MSWQQLLDIAAEATQAARDAQTRPPLACPSCGEPLRAGPDGTLFCPFDGWTDHGAG